MVSHTPLVEVLLVEVASHKNTVHTTAKIPFDCILPSVPVGSLPQLFTCPMFAKMFLLIYKPYKCHFIIIWSYKLFIFPSLLLQIRYSTPSIRCKSSHYWTNCVLSFRTSTHPFSQDCPASFPSISSAVLSLCHAAERPSTHSWSNLEPYSLYLSDDIIAQLTLPHPWPAPLESFRILASHHLLRAICSKTIYPFHLIVPNSWFVLDDFGRFFQPD